MKSKQTLDWATGEIRMACFERVKAERDDLNTGDCNHHWQFDWYTLDEYTTESGPMTKAEIFKLRQTQGWTREKTERWWREERILPHKGPDGKATTYALTWEKLLNRGCHRGDKLLYISFEAQQFFMAED